MIRSPAVGIKRARIIEMDTVEEHNEVIEKPDIGNNQLSIDTSIDLKELKKTRKKSKSASHKKESTKSCRVVEIVESDQEMEAN